MRIYTNQISGGLPDRKRQQPKIREVFSGSDEETEATSRQPAGEIRTVVPVRLDIASTLILMK